MRLLRIIKTYGLFIAVLLVCLSSIWASPGQTQEQTLSPKARAANLIVKITGDLENGTGNIAGAGIIFHIENDLVYIATAKHVVSEGNNEARNLHVEFRFLRGFPVQAELSRLFDSHLDLAVLLVSLKNSSILSAQTIASQVSLSLIPDVDIASRLQEGDDVYPIGHPTGNDWFAPYSPVKFRGFDGKMIKFEYTCQSGYSGGGLFTVQWELVGMLVKHNGPISEAVGFNRIKAKLHSWGYYHRGFCQQETNIAKRSAQSRGENDISQADGSESQKRRNPSQLIDEEQAFQQNTAKDPPLAEPQLSLIEIALPEIFQDIDISRKMTLDPCQVHSKIQQSPKNPLLYSATCQGDRLPTALHIQGFQTIPVTAPTEKNTLKISVDSASLIADVTVSLPKDAALTYKLGDQEIAPGEREKRLLMPVIASPAILEMTTTSSDVSACNFSTPVPLQDILEKKHILLTPVCRNNLIRWPEHWATPAILNQSCCVKAEFPVEQSQLECLRKQEDELILSWGKGWQPITISREQLNGTEDYQISLAQFAPFWPLQAEDPLLQPAENAGGNPCEAPPRYVPVAVHYCVGEATCRSARLEPNAMILPDIGLAGWKRIDPLPSIIRIELKKTSHNPLYKDTLYFQWRPVDRVPSVYLNDFFTKSDLIEELPVSVDIETSIIGFNSNAKMLLFHDKNTCQNNMLIDAIKSTVYTATGITSFQANACSYAAIVKGTDRRTSCVRGEKEEGKIVYSFDGKNSIELKCLQDNSYLSNESEYQLGAFFHYGHEFSIRTQNWADVGTENRTYLESVAVTIVPYLKKIDTGGIYIWVPEPSNDENYLLSRNDNRQIFMIPHPSYYPTVILTPLFPDDTQLSYKKALQRKLVSYLNETQNREFIEPLFERTEGFAVVSQYTHGKFETICKLHGKKIGSLESLLTFILSKKTASFLNRWKYGIIKVEPKGINENVDLGFVYFP